MPNVATARKGARITILQRPLPFSFWPMYRCPSASQMALWGAK